MRPDRRATMLALALALGATAAVAVAAGIRAAAPQGWWAAGYWRLVADAVTDRFDRWVGPAVLGALVVALVASRRGWRRGAGVATAVVVAVVAVRVLLLVDLVLASRGPNVLLVSIDTLRADRLGAYGYAGGTTPTIDRRLAGEGVTVDATYSQSPKTTPSHLTMLTSLYPSEHGIEMWEGDAGGHALAPQVHTLAEVLKAHGWATAGFTGGANVDASRGFDQGFDVYRDGHQVGRFARWVGRHRWRKWFVFLHTYAVHDPYVPPPALVQRFAPGYDGPMLAVLDRLRRGAGGSWEGASKLFWSGIDRDSGADVRLVSQLYDAGVFRMDDEIVRPVLDRLDALGLRGDTLVVLTSDHGEALGEHRRFLHDDLYEHTLRVPLIVRFPGRLAPGTRIAGPARTLDLMPTVLDLVGVPAPPQVQGRSLAGALRGGPAPAAPPVVSEYSNRRIGRVFESLRANGLTYVVDRGAEELYDRRTDPAETTNLAASAPPTLADMRRGLDGWRATVAPLAQRFGPGDLLVRPDERVRQQLRALGYVE